MIEYSARLNDGGRFLCGIYGRNERCESLLKAFRSAVPYTAPVFFGYIFLGTTYGILLNSSGYGVLWALLTSVFIYAGSMQFVLIGLLSGPVNLLNAFLLTLSVNARHVTYGISMLGRFREMGKKKPYLIHALTDETYSLLCGIQPPEGVESGDFYLAVSVLNQCYWVAGSVIGSLAGSLLSFNTRGIEFALTAMFVAMLVGQWESQKNHIPALAGLSLSVICLVVFGPSSFLIPAIIAIVACLMLMRGKLGRDFAAAEESGEEGVVSDVDN